jgi:hypothetical protein
MHSQLANPMTGGGDVDVAGVAVVEISLITTTRRIARAPLALLI